MSEPKYQLNKRDAARWHELLVRHCLECPAKPGGKVRRHKKYPPLNPEENAEFEALSAKRSRKHAAHPIVQASIRRTKRRDAKLGRLIKKLERLLAPARKKLKELKIDVD